MNAKVGFSNSQLFLESSHIVINIGIKAEHIGSPTQKIDNRLRYC